MKTNYFFIVIFALVNQSTLALADVTFKDAKSDYSIVLKNQGDQVMFSRCSLLQVDVCDPIGTPNGYNLKEALSVAKKNLAFANTGSVLIGVMMVLALLLVGGMTIIAAVGVVSSLVAGAIGTAIISVVVAMAAGGNLYMFSKRIPGDIAEMKTTVRDSRALKNGLTSQSSHTITVSDLKKVELYLNDILTK